MTITYPLSLPVANSVKAVRVNPITLVGGTRSEFSGSEQIQKHPGQWWEFDVQLPIKNRADAELWIAWLLKLNGRYGTFLWGDPSGATARGSMSVTPGTPLLKGAHSIRATSITIDGLPNNVTGYALPGDYIQLGSGSTARLHKILNQLDTNGSGEATADIFPFLKTAYADNSALVVSNCVGVFRLADNNLSYDIDEAVLFSKSFSIRESF